jgi:GAF domain-containing protein
MGALLPIDYQFDPGCGVPGWVMRTHTPYLSEDAEHDPHVIPEIQQALSFRTLLNVPILSRSEQLLGCFELHNKTAGQSFHQQDVDLLKGLAASAAIALENASGRKKNIDVWKPNCCKPRRWNPSPTGASCMKGYYFSRSHSRSGISPPR